MNVRKRLLLNSTLIFGLVFTVSAFLVYSVFYRNSEQIIFNELESTTLLTAYFYLEEDELSRKEHNKIRKEFFEKIQNSKVKLYDDHNEFAFGDSSTGKSQFLTNEVIDKTRKLGKLKFKEGNSYFYGIHYPDNQGDFVVFVITENEFFESQAQQLVIILIASLIMGLLLIILLSYYLSKLAYQPITQIVNQIDSVDIYSMETSALSVPKTKDEVQRLAIQFNHLLSRLSDNFLVQKNFINYLSHEIKTPLAAISGNLEVFGQKDRKPEEYNEVAKRSLGYVYEIEDIITNLLILSGLEKSDSFQESLRVDELVWRVMEKVTLNYPQANQQIQFDIRVENPNLLQQKGSKGQLEIAIYNLIENALKYSNEKPIQIAFSEVESRLQLEIKDEGEGIPEEELNYIHQPFQRGSNVLQTKGSGIGLSLAVLIFKQNNVGFSIHSEIKKGTTIQLTF